MALKDDYRYWLLDLDATGQYEGADEVIVLVPYVDGRAIAGLMVGIPPHDVAAYNVVGVVEEGKIRLYEEIEDEKGC